MIQQIPTTPLNNVFAFGFGAGRQIELIPGTPEERCKKKKKNIFSGLAEAFAKITSPKLAIFGLCGMDLFLILLNQKVHVL